MIAKLIAFKDVKPGNEIYDPSYYASNKWRKVSEIKISKSGTVSLYIGVSSHPIIDTRTQFCGYKEQGILVKEN